MSCTGTCSNSTPGPPSWRRQPPGRGRRRDLPGRWTARISNATFTILESDTVNAFSHQGGHLTLGLLRFLGEDDAALEFVVGHEIAHVDLEHAQRCLATPGGRLRLKLGTIRSVYLFPAADGLFRLSRSTRPTPGPAEKCADGRTDHEAKAASSGGSRVTRSGTASATGAAAPVFAREESPGRQPLPRTPAAWRRLRKLKESASPAAPTR
ncbi:MAG: M48 family metalloprotease [Isosphaeraceae bacterium]